MGGRPSAAQPADTCLLQGGLAIAAAACAVQLGARYPRPALVVAAILLILTARRFPAFFWVFASLVLLTEFVFAAIATWKGI
jgi:hypothetical protein